MPTAGPIARNVRASVEELAEARGLSMRRLSAMLEDLGRSIPPLGLARILKDERRVDVDELVALAAALGVNPSALLLPRHVDRETEVDLTPEMRQRAYVAWGWMRGRWPLPEHLLPEGAALGFPQTVFAEFAERTRPDFDGPLDDPAVSELVELQQLIELVLGDPDPAAHWVRTRNTIARQVKLVELRLQGLFDQLDGAIQQFDAAGAIEALAVTRSDARGVIGYAPGQDPSTRGHRTAEPEVPEPGPGAAPTSRSLFDPFGNRGER